MTRKILKHRACCLKALPASRRVLFPASLAPAAPPSKFRDFSPPFVPFRGSSFVVPLSWFLFRGSGPSNHEIHQKVRTTRKILKILKPPLPGRLSHLPLSIRPLFSTFSRSPAAPHLPSAAPLPNFRDLSLFFVLFRGYYFVPFRHLSCPFVVPLSWFLFRGSGPSNHEIHKKNTNNTKNSKTPPLLPKRPHASRHPSSLIFFFPLAPKAPHVPPAAPPSNFRVFS